MINLIVGPIHSNIKFKDALYILYACVLYQLFVLGERSRYNSEEEKL